MHFGEICLISLCDQLGAAKILLEQNKLDYKRKGLGDIFHEEGKVMVRCGHCLMVGLLLNLFDTFFRVKLLSSSR